MIVFVCIVHVLMVLVSTDCPSSLYILSKKWGVERDLVRAIALPGRIINTNSTAVWGAFIGSLPMWYIGAYGEIIPLKNTHDPG